MIWPTLLQVAQCVLGTPWFQVSSRKCLVLRGIYPLPLALPKRELGQHLLSRERAKLRGRGKTEKWDSPLVFVWSCDLNMNFHFCRDGHFNKDQMSEFRE